MKRPRIGITVDVEPQRLVVSPLYAHAVVAAGGVPVLLAPFTDAIAAYLDDCDGFLLTGGDDPATERFGEPTHPKAKPIDAVRQTFEVALLVALARHPATPVLGVCLGMQLMSLLGGGTLDQHLPETLATADRHWGRVEHPVAGPLGDGVVLSHHRQAVRDPGALSVVATAPDGVIEAVKAEDRAHYVGVQWHPERTADARLGRGVIEMLVRASTG